MNIPHERLCATAGVGLRTYWALLQRAHTPRASTLARLNSALSRHRIGFGSEAGSLAPHAALKACMVLAAFRLNANARNALSADPGRRATMDRDWIEAAKVRRVALYIANQFFGFRQSDLARAANMTKQAVSNAVQQLVDQQDSDPELKTLLDELEEILS